MNKFKFSKIFLSLASIILFSSLNFVNGENIVLDIDQKEDCQENFNCNNQFVAPITASIMGSLIIGSQYIQENNPVLDPPLIKQKIIKQYVLNGPLLYSEQAAISTFPVSSIVAPVASSFVPDPLLSSAIFNGLASIPTSSTIISSPLALGSYSSYDSSFFSRVPFALSSIPVSSPVTIPSAFTSLYGLFPKHNYKIPRIVSYYSPPIDYKTRLRDFEFNAVVTFGDSLSDTGTRGRDTVYMANGDIFNLYNNLVSVYLSGKPHVPVNFGGTNYAVSGAIISAEGLTGFDINYYRTAADDQINWYLKDNKGKADPNSIYLYWIGGNDLASILSAELPRQIVGSIFSFNSKEKFNKIFDEKGYYEDKKTITAMVKSLEKLLDAGAGYVYFMNLPASGYAPFTQMFLEGATLGSVDLIIERYPLIVFSPSYWLSKIADDYLRNPANHIGNPRGRGKDYIIENNVEALSKRYFFIPKDWLRFYYNFAANIQNAVVRQFNNEAARQLASINDRGNIIYADIDSLFNEILDNYQDFGIDEVLVPQCQLGLQSTSCNAGDERYHDDKVYAFTDWHHPSAYSHLIIAQYLIELLNAPQYVAALTRNLENIDISRADFISQQLSDIRQLTRRSDSSLRERKIIPIFGYSGMTSKVVKSFIDSKHDLTNILHTGFAYNAGSNIQLGIVGSFGFGKQTPHNQINFKQHNESLTLFSQYTDNEYWANISFTGGIYKANDINRVMTFGQLPRAGTRVETSSTSGRLLNVALKSGKSFSINDGTLLSPNIGYSASKYKIDGIVEHNNLSTSMIFGKQSSTSHILSAGLELNVKQITSKLYSPVLTSFEFNYNHSLNNKDLIIDNVSLKSTPNLTFSRKGMTYKNGKAKDWIDISPKVVFKIGQNTYLNTSLNYQLDLKGKNNNSRLNFNLGLKSSF